MTPTSASARLAWAGLISMVFSLSVGVAGPARANGYGVSTDPTLSYPVDIAGRQTLGVISVFGNDWYGIPFGDRYDRWRTGDFTVSVLRGNRWRDQLPSQPFELMEYRFRGEVIAPDNLTAPAPGDRLYAPSWWLGATTHFGWSGYDVAAGADLVMVGPQTGIEGIHSAIHEAFGNVPINLPPANQVSNGIYLDAHAEVGRGIALSFGEVRPFVEVRAGVETLARAGVDVTFGTLGQDGLRLRDQVSGQRVAALNGSGSVGGWSFLVGADTAYVASSVYLPDNRGPELEELRHRVRAGVNFGVGNSNFFYGMTYLSEEFEGQPEGQVVGTLSVDIRF
jgi:hypothetical protein